MRISLIFHHILDATSASYLNFNFSADFPEAVSTLANLETSYKIGRINKLNMKEGGEYGNIETTQDKKS